MSYRYEVLVDNKWHKNAVVFETEEEADKAGSQKFHSWTLCEGYRAVETDKPANYRWDDERGLVDLATDS